MSFKILLITATITIIAAILGWKGSAMRKKIPSQEVIPLNQAIAVINGESRDLADRLRIKILSGANNTRKLAYDTKGVCLIEGLSNQKQYTIEIRRSDIKGMFLYEPLRMNVKPRENGSKYFVLVGASIGKAWEFHKIPNRLGWGNNIILGYRAKYDFDKSTEINSLVAMPTYIAGVIIKECAAYFPRDMGQSQKLIREWVSLLRFNHIIPILATVVPVTKEHDAKHLGRLISILAFNDFVREYAFQEGILVLDLEKAVRMSDTDRRLRNEYAQPDGLHLLKKAYDDTLDGIVLPVINSAINNPPKE